MRKYNLFPGLLLLVFLGFMLASSGCGGAQYPATGGLQPGGYGEMSTLSSLPAPPAAAKPLSSNRKQPALDQELKYPNKAAVQISLSAGWNTISFPFASVSSASGFSYHIYKFNGSGYDEIDPINHPEAIDCRYGYWAYADSAGQVSVDGAANQSIYDISLTYGWNFLGLPFNADPYFRSLSITHEGQKSLQQASSLDVPPGAGIWTYGKLYAYSHQAWQELTAATGDYQLVKGCGYWLWCWNQDGVTTFNYYNPSSLAMEFVEVPAGTFPQGSPAGVGQEAEHPQHNVYLYTYEIGKYEVTNAQFAAFADASGYSAQGNWRTAGGSLPDYAADYPGYPVVAVNWNDAQAFCAWAGYTLPTEAQWEKAAGGAGHSTYPWGENWNNNNCNNLLMNNAALLPLLAPISGSRGTLPGSAFPAGSSPYGAMDMAGNVWEWCSDWYGETYYSTYPYNNPSGPASGTDKVFRGGAWDDSNIDNYRCASRTGFVPPEANYFGLGFRCVGTITLPPEITALNPASGSAGMLVTVTGNAFGPVQGASGVIFTGHEAAVISWSDTAVVCTVPQDALTGNVTVYTLGGESNGVSFTVNSAVIAMEFVTVQSGGFFMGSQSGVGSAFEHPQHSVYLDNYQIGKYEVTNGQFAQFVAATGYSAQGHWNQAYISGYPQDYPDYPVLSVTWNDAKAFCDWAGYRLPTEAQWEKAARGTVGQTYPWGNTWSGNKYNFWEGLQLPGMLNLSLNRGTLPGGSFLDGASPYNAMDMAGNVWEWCSDWWQGDYYSVSPSSNPPGPATGTDKVMRGMSWYDYGSDYCRCAFRNFYAPGDWNFSLGFRCAR